jgi:hypothetical protein
MLPQGVFESMIRRQLRLDEREAAPKAVSRPGVFDEA